MLSGAAAGAFTSLNAPFTQFSGQTGVFYRALPYPLREMFINRKIIGKTSKNSNLLQPDIVIKIATVVI